MYARCFRTRLYKTKRLRLVESLKLRRVPVYLNYSEKVMF